MLKKIAASIVISICLSAAAAAQSAHTPEKGSAERAAILNALRVPVEKALKQKIVFAANDFRVMGNWAFLSGEPQSPAGGKPNYRGTKYQKAVDLGMFDDGVFALLKKTGTQWKVVTYAIGCTDVCYLDWSSRYKAPKGIFPYSQ
jgi:hypothetical protein